MTGGKMLEEFKHWRSFYSVRKSKDMMHEKLDQILAMIPYDDLFNKSFDVLKRDGMLEGKNSDVEYMILEQVLQFKEKYGKQIQEACWDVIFRHIRKNMSNDMMKRYYTKLAENKADIMAKDLVAAMTEDMADLDAVDLGGSD